MQRVLSKKIDPRTHECFLDVLMRENSNVKAANGIMERQNQTLPLAIFWNRMVQVLKDIVEKSFQKPTTASSSTSSSLLTVAQSASSTTSGSVGTPSSSVFLTAQMVLTELYPSLRKSLVDLVSRLKSSTESESEGHSASSSNGFLFKSNLTARHPDLMRVLGRSSSSLLDSLEGLNLAERDKGVDVMISGSCSIFRRHRGHLSDDMVRTIIGDDTSTSPFRRGTQDNSKKRNDLINGSGGGGGGENYDSDLISLLRSLETMESRFLAKSLETVLKPVEQMFPSMEGYTNAIPSKHDILSLYATHILLVTCHNGKMTLFHISLFLFLYFL